MNNLLKISLLSCLILSTSNAEDKIDGGREVSVRKAIDSFGSFETTCIKDVDTIGEMFTEGKFSAQFRSVYAGYNQKARGETDTYATAIGGMMKYELAMYNGFNAAIAGIVSQDLDFLTGKREKQNDELSSDKSNYTQLSELYINYKHDGLNLRAGAQTLDTPLADSDDIRMVPNTFEAYMATYEYDKFTFTFGNLQRWQGVDAGLGSGDEDEWVDIGDNGAWVGGVAYDGIVEANAWYYDISGDAEEVHAAYFDVSKGYDINDDISIYGGIQYLHEANVGISEIEADVYGVMAEFVAYDIGFNIAYNYSDGKDGKRSFSGIGGGSMYTSMDTMIIDELTEGRDVHAIVAGLVYQVANWEFLYAYGDFDAKQDKFGESGHIVEQDMGFAYTLSDKLEVAVLYVMEDDRGSSRNTQNDWDRYQLIVKYDF